jgi:hypothetical protein
MSWDPDLFVAASPECPVIAEETKPCSTGGLLDGSGTSWRNGSSGREADQHSFWCGGQAARPDLVRFQPILVDQAGIVRLRGSWWAADCGGTKSSASWTVSQAHAPASGAVPTAAHQTAFGDAGGHLPLGLGSATYAGTYGYPSGFDPCRRDTVRDANSWNQREQSERSPVDRPHLCRSGARPEGFEPPTF